jgi:predicted GNAT family acetyltransferase
MYEIQHDRNGKYGTFFLEIDDKKLAIMTYIMTDDKNMIVEHTEVDSSLKGQGIGKILVKTLVDFSRQHHIKVRATCSFVNSVLNRNPEWHDILA